MPDWNVSCSSSVKPAPSKRSLITRVSRVRFFGNEQPAKDHPFLLSAKDNIIVVSVRETILGLGLRKRFHFRNKRQKTCSLLLPMNNVRCAVLTRLRDGHLDHLLFPKGNRLKMPQDAFLEDRIKFLVHTSGIRQSCRFCHGSLRAVSGARQLLPTTPPKSAGLPQTASRASASARPPLLARARTPPSSGPDSPPARC